MKSGAVLNEKELKALRYLNAYPEHDFFRKITERDKNIFYERVGNEEANPKSFGELSALFNLTREACRYNVIKVCKKIGGQVGSIESRRKHRMPSS